MKTFNNFNPQARGSLFLILGAIGTMFLTTGCPSNSGGSACETAVPTNIIPYGPGVQHFGKCDCFRSWGKSIRPEPKSMNLALQFYSGTQRKYLWQYPQAHWNSSSGLYSGPGNLDSFPDDPRISVQLANGTVQRDFTNRRSVCLWPVHDDFDFNGWSHTVDHQYGLKRRD